jgi:hypothetical protein
MLTRDRRRLPRSPTTIFVEALDGGDWMVAHDISLGGMMVTSRALRWPGQHVRVRFSLPGEQRAIRATCRIVDLADVPLGSGLALEFLRLHPQAQLALHRYVDRRPLQPAEDDSVSSRVVGWVRRIVEDCAQLGALART